MTRRLCILFITLLCLPLAAQRSDFMRKEALMPLVDAAGQAADGTLLWNR